MSAEQTQPTSKSKGLIKTILLIVFAITSLLFFVFGFIQKLEADKQRDRAVMLQHQAAEAMQEAEKQRTRAEEALVACEKSKKK